MDLLIALVFDMVVLLLEELVFTNTHYIWVGGIIPLLGTIGIIFLLIKSGNNQVSGYIIAVIGVVLLLLIWLDGHSRYKRRQEAKRIKKNQED